MFKLAGLKELVMNFHGIENHGIKGCAQRARSALGGNGTVWLGVAEASLLHPQT